MASTCKAIVCTAPGQAEVQDVPIPRLRADSILVLVKAAGLNPTDWKSINFNDTAGLRLGCDFAGVVEEVGGAVTKPFKKGDRVCGLVFAANTADTGSFGQYTPAKECCTVKIPEKLSFEEAATLGVGITTVGQGLYQSLKLPLPDSPSSSPTPILIWGGSTATGILGIQFAKLSGFTVITTCSPHNFEYLKSLGADVTYDYHTESDALAREIKTLTENKLFYAWDCSPTPDSARVCALAMSDSEKGLYSSLAPVDAEKIVKPANSLVDTDWTIGYTAFGETFTRGGRVFEAKPEDSKFAKMFWELSAKLLAEGKVKVARMAVDQGGSGLKGIFKGLEDLKQGRVSGTKLVYRI